MNEYCIAVIRLDDDKEDPVELFHTHVLAPGPNEAIEGMFRASLNNNVSLAGAHAISMKLLVKLPESVVDGYEHLRKVTHAWKAAAPTPDASGHIHTLH